MLKVNLDYLPPPLVGLPPLLLLPLLPLEPDDELPLSLLEPLLLLDGGGAVCVGGVYVLVGASFDRVGLESPLFDLVGVELVVPVVPLVGL